MKAAILGPLFFAVLGSAAVTCNRDNCYRAVLGTNSGQSASHVQDCSRFVSCTSTPAPTTTTVTQTVTPSATTLTFTGVQQTSVASVTVTNPAVVITSAVTLPDSTTTTTSSGPVVTITTTVYPSFGGNNAKQKRATTAAPASSCTAATVPAYASFCSGASRYASACACAGVTTVTSMPTRSTVTTTVTSTLVPVTVSTTVTPAPTTITSTVTQAGVTSVVPVTVPGMTTTVTVTVAGSTTTVSATPTPPALCGNAGVQWAYYTDNQAASSTADDQAFDPTVVKTETPSGSGTTTFLYIDDESASNGSNEDIYGESLPSTNYVLNHRGYVFAPETGTYSFAATNVDDVWEFWLGSAAYSGWTKANSNQITYYNNGPGSNTYTANLVGGNYYAIRAIFKQGPPFVASYGFTITTPSGMTIIGRDTSADPYVVQYSCDGVLAPMYPPFGQET